MRIPSLTSGLLFALMAGSVLVLTSCGSDDQDRADGGSKSSSDENLQPREPSFPGKSRDFGVAGRSDGNGGGPANGYQDRSRYYSPYDRGYPPGDAERTRDRYAPLEPPFWQRSPEGGIISSDPLREQSQSYRGGSYSSPDPYGGGYGGYASPNAGSMRPQQYSFRPLTDREKERMYPQGPGSGYPSYGPYGTLTPYQPYQASPPYLDPAYPGLDRDGYSYWTPAPRSEDGSVSPPQSWGQRQDRTDQWGTTPREPYSPPLQRWSPAERMLPNLDESADRSFAAN